MSFGIVRGVVEVHIQKNSETGPVKLLKYFDKIMH